MDLEASIFSIQYAKNYQYRSQFLPVMEDLTGEIFDKLLHVDYTQI